LSQGAEVKVLKLEKLKEGIEKIWRRAVGN
jgi:hypothetical protein